MTYVPTFALMRDSLISYCKQRIAENYGDALDIWLILEANLEFGYGYLGIFKEHFRKYITKEVEAKLWFASKQLLYAVHAFLNIHGDDCALDLLLRFVELFVAEQLDHFANDYDTSAWLNEGNLEEDCKEDRKEREEREEKEDMMDE